MDISELMSKGMKFGSSSNYVQLRYLLNDIKKGNIRLMENTEEVPMETTMCKIATSFPIHIVMSTRRINGKMRQTVIKGNGDLKNIMTWINEDIPVTIQGESVFFKNMPEHLTNYILNELPISSTIINERTGALSDEELIEIIRTYY